MDMDVDGANARTSEWAFASTTVLIDGCTGEIVCVMRVQLHVCFRGTICQLEILKEATI
jgi:hypothetical protein